MKDFNRCLSVVAFFALTIVAFGIMNFPKAEAQVGKATICDSVHDQSAHLCDVYCDKLGCDVGGADMACAKILQTFASLTDDPRFFGCAAEGAVMSCGGRIQGCTVSMSAECQAENKICVRDACTNAETCL